METKESKNVTEIALDYVNHTERNVFLTGGAGTGKTTFLRFLKAHSNKKLVIAAPTGVAAVNAGGITLHALFGITAQGSHLPGISEYRLTGQSKALLRELELLVVDEVSMLRADLLDVMDTILREVRQNQRPLGGIQVLFIGDLYQLPPVKKEQGALDENGISRALYFYASNVFERLKIITLELQTVYRQADPEFIKLLNAFRKGKVSHTELDMLNKRYDVIPPNNHPIVLTTHNRKASQINAEQLGQLQTKLCTYLAHIKDEFPEDKFPVDVELSLKIGCRIMVIKNDTSSKQSFYNGKTGVLTSMTDEFVEVLFDDNTIASLGKETWLNMGYETDELTRKFKEVILGTFTQFPIRLAWSITVHKSQGLTFDGAVLDLSDAFAAGQVYVALSRIKTIDGIFLEKKIDTAVVVAPDIEEAKFSILGSLELNNDLQISKCSYMEKVCREVLDWQSLTDTFAKTRESDVIISDIFDKLVVLEKQAATFLNEIVSRLSKPNGPDWTLLSQRVSKADNYFNGELRNNCITPLKQFVKSHKEDYMFRGRINLFKGYIDQLENKIRSMNSVSKLASEIEKGLKYLPETSVSHPKEVQSTKKGKSPSSLPIAESTSTESQSLILFSQGRSIKEIAADRALGIPAVESHLASFLPTGEIKLSDLIPQGLIEEIVPKVQHLQSPSISDLRRFASGKLSMGQLYALRIYLSR